MTIQLLRKDHLHSILPLLGQVHALHCAAQPHRYRALPEPDDVLVWLRDWVTAQGVDILISGPVEAPMGYLAYVIVDKPQSVIRPAQRYAVLEHICVDTSHRRHGIGQQLVAAMRNRLRKEDVTHIRAQYGGWNTASAAFLAREGFAVSMTEVEAAL